MPQMSPMNWMYLMIIFLIMLILINTLLYFMKMENKNYSIIYLPMKKFKKLW